jgi:hypothetical protein
MVRTGRLLGCFLCGDLQEHVLEAHADRSQFEEPPAAGHDRVRELPAHVELGFALDLVGDGTTRARRRLGRYGRPGVIRSRDPGDAGDRRQHRARVRAPRVDLQIHRCRSLQARGQIVGCVDSHDASLVDDHHALAGLRDLWQDVRAEHDGVIARQAANEVACLDDLLRIEARGWLVQNQHIGIVNERLREADALLEAFRELAAVAIGDLADPGAIHDRRHPLPAFSRGNALDAGDEVEIFTCRHLGIERRRLRQVPGAPLGGDRVVENVVSRDHGAPFGRRHIARENPHRRGFARAVRAKKAEDLSALDPETDVVDGGHGAVALGDVLNLDHTSTPFPTPRWTGGVLLIA